MSTEINLELLNGNWAIAAASLMIICCAYFSHEARARHIFEHGGRLKLTPGMRVALALAATSAGILIRSIEVWRWRIGGGVMADLNQIVLTIGCVIAVIGFMCAVREYSLRLYGRGPWVWTLVAMVAFNVMSVAHHLGWMIAR